MFDEKEWTLWPLGSIIIMTKKGCTYAKPLKKKTVQVGSCGLGFPQWDYGPSVVSPGVVKRQWGSVAVILGL